MGAGTGWGRALAEPAPSSQVRAGLSVSSERSLRTGTIDGGGEQEGGHGGPPSYDPGPGDRGRRGAGFRPTGVASDEALGA